MAEKEQLLFHWSDYLVFILSLVLSGSVGVIQGVVDMVRSKNKKADDMEKSAKGGEPERNISVWPASLSVMASTLAAPFVLGVPAEIYAHGTTFAFVTVGYVIGVPICTHLFFTRFYDMGISSIYEYLEFRFSKAVRSICTFIFAFTIIVYIGIITYAPALAFSQVTGLSTQISILGVGLIGIVYTSVGGLKGVIWVDAIQMVIILVSILAIIIKGTVAVGGWDVVWQKASEGGRIRSNEFSLNPIVRHTFWTQAIGGAVMSIVIFTNQSIVQKFLGLPTRKKMHITAYTSMVAIVSYMLLFAFSGLVMYAYYYDCSPLKTGQIKTADQLIPIFVLEIFQGFYGFPGLFTAAVFSASLSSMAGGINALAAVTILDVLNPLYTKRTGRTQFPPKQLLLIFKGLILVYGFITIGFAYLAPFLGSGLLVLALNLLGVVGAPMLALFIMGIFMPCVNSLGAVVGLFASLAVMLWLSIGGMYVIAKYKVNLTWLLPLNGTCPRGAGPSAGLVSTMSGITDGTLFDGMNATSLTGGFTGSGWMPTVTESSLLGGLGTTGNDVIGSLTSALPPLQPSNLEKFYLVSYMWYYVIAIVVALIVSLLVSWCSGFRRGMPVDTTLSYMCCYKQAEEPLYTSSVHVQLTPEDQTQLNAEKSQLNGSHVNPAFEQLDRQGTPPATVAPADTVEPFEDYNDTGVYNYGIFVRDRCSRCRRSKIVHCTKF